MRDAAEHYDVRILMLDEGDQVTLDTSGDLAGKQLTIPGPETLPDFAVRGERYPHWRPGEGDPGSDLILAAPFPPSLSMQIGGTGGPPEQGGQAPHTIELDYRLLVAVPESTIARAWLGLLPGLLIAAAVALPVAVVLAVGIARYVTRPLDRLTLAAQQMAQGEFDIDVPVARRDEVGELARAFSSTATRVGEAQAQMRMLVASVSHDIKTPLTSILGFAQALRSGVASGDAESRHAGEVIHEEAERLGDRLSDLLFLSEIESGHVVLQREPVDIGELARTTAERVLAGVRERGVSVSVDAAADVLVSGDRQRIERVLENLLDNAGKFTPAGGRVDVRVYRDEDGPPLACVDVANGPVDIDPDELPRLFERFYRREHGRVAAGSGLGLPIARDLIELHAGSLDASIQDDALVFAVRLPAAGR